MEMKAKPVLGSVEVVEVQNLPDGDVCLVVPCQDSDHYTSLPAGLEYDGQVFGRTGWNSDSHRACYKRSKKFAVGI